MSDRERISYKLEKLLSYYTELKDLSSISMDAYLNSAIYRRATERIMQLIVECACEINNMLLKMHGKREFTDPGQSFVHLAELKIFPAEFALHITPTLELSNRLRFDYEDLDDSLVYHAISSYLENYLKYMYYINQYLRYTQ